MKSAIFFETKKISIQEMTIPKISANDVLIKVMACGICGTDVHIYEGDKGAAECYPPTILGHEFSGIVERVGDYVTEWEIGDRVCVDPNQLCNSCYYCKAGIGHFCESMIGIGTTVNGGFSQYCVVSKTQIYKMADSVSFEEGAMTEPLACCLHGIDLCEILPAQEVVIIGGGMIGQLMLQLAKLAGAHKVAMIEPIEIKRELAKTLGANITINPLSENAKEVLGKNGFSNIRTVIECAGLPITIKQAIELAGKKSTVMLFGLTKEDDEVELKPFEIFRKEVTLKASFINPYTQQRALDLINSGKIDVKSMIVETISLEELENVLSSPELRAKGKYIVNPWI